MSRFDITATTVALRRLVETTTNPRHRYLLQACERLRLLEIAGRWEDIFASAMTVAHPVYHFRGLGQVTVLDGADAVQTAYKEWAADGQSIVYTADERLAVGDHLVCSTATLHRQTPGEALIDLGIYADPDATYLVSTVEHLTWTFDDEGRLLHADAWEIDESTREFLKIDPSEVLTSETAALMLDPFIAPLPTRPF